MTDHLSSGESQLGLKLIKQEKENYAFYVGMWRKPPESLNPAKI